MFVSRDSILYQGREHLRPRPPLPRSKRFKVGEWVEELENPEGWGQVIEVDGEYVTYRRDLGEEYQDTQMHATSFRRTRRRWRE